MCCLGVLAKLAGCTFSRLGSEFPYVDELDGDQVAPRAAMNFVGLSKDDGRFIDDRGLTDTLAGRNDSGASFAEIANIIESEPRGLFAESVEP
jgi:hypothetical protein